jgi:hypothetical protein
MEAIQKSVSKINLKMTNNFDTWKIIKIQKGKSGLGWKN